MSSWSEVRRLAGAWHLELYPTTVGLVPAADLLVEAEKVTGVRRLCVPAGDVLLDGAEAIYDREGHRILYSNGLAEDIARFYVAHEYGHHRLHDAQASCCDDDLDAWTPAEPEGSVVGENDAYSPKQRTEAQANLFAREFLLPRAKLKVRCEGGGISAAKLATELGLPLNLVLQQMADALLLPDDPPDMAAKPPLAPDPSQLEAITAPAGPHQVRAGPGTGKTRTLVGRIAHLIETGEDPLSILGLTYSNASAQDLGLRVRAAVGSACPSIWTGTFHAFGLELLRKYGEEIGLPADLKPLDRSDELFLMEELLPELGLSFYLDLHEPLRSLKAVLNAIGRAKDEMCGPTRYFELATGMEAKAGSEAEIEAAARALEVARVYAVYEEALRDRGLLDFGDLILRPVELLRARPAIAAEVRGRFRHVLVDEYQDMNRASGRFLAELVEPAKGPWVVGDIRQSIYRFRGASPLNMTRFAAEFPGAEHTDLAINYRSGGRIVRTFELFGKSMTCAPLASATPLSAHLGDNAGEVAFDVAITREAEAEGLAQRIRQRTANGGRTGDHAILGRSHSTLARIAAHLERAGVPCLYFGDFFERPEVRDLLCLLSVAGEPEGVGLMRLGQMAPFVIPVPDILAILRWREAQDITLLTALKRLKLVADLSPVGLSGLQRLAQDLEDVSFTTSPHALLVHHLFVLGGVFQSPLSDPSVAGQQRRLAVYQLLQVAYEYRGSPGRDPKREFLEYVRRLEILDEEKDLRQLPAAAAGVDAVRLMTVHASKGLEFPVVHVPSLSPSLFPAQGRYEPCPAPDGMIDKDALLGRDAEEESLFFVALSRAQAALGLSRANAYGGWSRPNPSKLLAPIAACLPTAAKIGWTNAGLQPPPFKALALDPLGDEIDVRDLETYQECPRRFYYAHGLGLRSRGVPSPYVQFLSAVRAGLSWLRQTARESHNAGFKAHFEETWRNMGPVGHAHSAVYRANAEAMLATARTVMDGTSLEVDRRLSLGARQVLARADHIQMVGQTITIQRLKAGRLAKTEKLRTRDNLIQTIVAADHPGNVVRFEQISLLTGERRIDSASSDKLAKSRGDVVSAFAAIAEGRFDPIQNDRTCPTCPFYFICPTEGLPR